MQQISQTSLTILKVTALNGRIFPRFSAITPFYLSLNGKPIVSGRNAIGETKKKKEEKKIRIETESETMYIQAVRSRSKDYGEKCRTKR